MSRPAPWAGRAGGTSPLPECRGPAAACAVRRRGQPGEVDGRGLPHPAVERVATDDDGHGRASCQHAVNRPRAIGPGVGLAAVARGNRLRTPLTISSGQFTDVSAAGRATVGADSRNRSRRPGQVRPVHLAITVTSGLAAAWATYLLRDQLRPGPGREPLWRRAILTRREDLRVGAAVCGSAGACSGLAISLLGETATVLEGVAAILGAVAVVTSVCSLMPGTDRRLVVYRDTAPARRHRPRRPG